MNLQNHSKNQFSSPLPLYAAGEKKNTHFNQIKFAKLISKFSKTKVVIIKNFEDLGKCLSKNLISNEIVIGMGAGLISKYIRELKVIL